jgi:hypothetical protein
MTWIIQSTGPARRRSVFGAIHATLIITLIGGAGFWLVPGMAKADDLSRPYGLTIFGGRMLENDWEKSYWPPNIEFLQPYNVGVGLSRRLGTAFGFLDFEFEGQAVYRFRGENLWEFNFPIIGRFSQFPWSDTVPTSFAFGVGVSYTSEESAVELAHRGEVQRLLAYWVGEIEVGVPNEPWSGLLRLHHRSTAWGFFGDGNPGSNFLVLGIRRRF